MSTYTDTLGLEEITPGDQAGLWGNTTNNNLALIDQAVTGVTPISFTGVSGTVRTLDAANGALDEARAAVLNITGIATGSNTVVVPNKQKTYLVRNATGRDVIFRTATPTATYSVEAGNSILVFCDGNNNVFTGIQAPGSGTLTVSGGGTGATTFGGGGFVKSSGGTNALTVASSVDLASDVTGVLPVPRGGTGAGTFTAGSLIVGNGTSNFGTLTGGANGQIATWNGSTWVAQAPATGGGTVTSVSGTGTVNGLTLTGTVTTTGNLTLGGSLSGSAPSLSVGSATSATSATNATNLTGSGTISSTTTIIGSTTGAPAASGDVGQLITIASPTVNLVNAVVVNVGSGTIPAGDWDIYGTYTVQITSGGTLNFINCGASLNSSTLTLTTGGPYSATGPANFSIAFPPQPFIVSSATTIFLNMFSGFSGAANGQVTIYARRRR